VNGHKNDVVQDYYLMSREENIYFEYTKTKELTRIESSDSLLYNKEFISKHVSFDDEDESVNDGEFIIDSGRSRVTVPVRLCQ
jgi:hypothetical protein